MIRLKKDSFVVLILFVLSGVSHASYEASLSDIQMQNVLQGYFPLKEYAAVARVILREPKVQLLQNNKDIVLIIPVDASIIGDVLHQGHVTVEVGLNYKAASGSVYLSQPRLKKFEMPSVDKAMVKELRGFVKTIMKNSLPVVVIYKLKEKDMNHSLATTALKKFELEDHKIKLVFGFK